MYCRKLIVRKIMTDITNHLTIIVEIVLDRAIVILSSSSSKIDFLYVCSIHAWSTEVHVYIIMNQRRQIKKI